MLAFIFGLIEGSTDGWTALPILSVVWGVVLFAGFGVRQARAPQPLIKPSLLQEQRDSPPDSILGLAFFAAVSGLAYVISLFFQLVLHLSPSHAALGLTPVMVGIIGASVVCRPLLTVLGRRLVALGLLTTLLGTLGLWLTIVETGEWPRRHGSLSPPSWSSVSAWAPVSAPSSKLPWATSPTTKPVVPAVP